METNRLRQFKVLVETRHLRNAAEILGISHGGLYKSLRQLERELSILLFYSKGKRLEITKEGLRLFEKIPQALECIDSLRQKEGHSPRKESVTFTVGTFEVFSTHLVSRLFREKEWESIRIRLVELIPGDLEKSIVANEIDVGVTYLPIPTPGLEFFKVKSFQMGVYCRKNSFRGVETVKLPFVVPARPLQGTPTGVRGLDGWPENLFPRQVLFEVDLMESALELVRRGRAAAFLPEPVVRSHNEKHEAKYVLEERPLGGRFPKVERDVFIVRLSEKNESRLEKRLASAIRRL